MNRVIWVDAPRKTGALFIALLARLSQVYADCGVIHVILDNDAIHSIRAVQGVVDTYDGRIVLDFLSPPYCPDDNRIARCMWRELHAKVTRNHRCRTMAELMQAVREHLIARTGEQRPSVAVQHETMADS
jgi:transposase